MAIQDPIFVPPFPNLLRDPNQNQHPLCLNQILALAAWKVSGNSILQTAYQTKQLTCLKVAEDQAHCIITKRGGESGVAGVFQEKIDPISAGVNCVLEFLSNLFSEGLEYRNINEYRSAISAYHEKAEGIPIGQHPKVYQNIL